jgi:glycerol-3-phosphate dehydrogenase
VTTNTIPMPAEPVRHEVERLRSLGATSVVIIGGGINGIATFRDLAMQGVDVVLVERSDFASGATAASSHMIHGGLRYLENGELRLVRESVHERNALLRTAPHFVTPLQTTIPIYATFSGLIAAPMRILRHRPGSGHKERGALMIKVGLSLYDTFSRDNGSVPRHRFLGRRKSLELLPALDPAIKYTATYYDASVHSPERLALDLVLDGEDAHAGAHAVNYVEAVALTGDSVRLRDTKSGVEFDVRADVIINASGPWTDLTNEALGRPTTYMGGTKGSHIVLDAPELLEATGGNEIFFEHSDGRIVLIYPLHGRVLVGTTDLEADPRDPAVCTEEEVDYFFDLIGHVFPGIPVDRSHIVFRYSGIRPLPHHDDISPGLVSRDYRIEIDDAREGAPVISLIGGKWTTFRALGETLADRALTILGTKRSRSTDGVQIGGGRDFPTKDAERERWLGLHLADVDASRRELLFGRYGTRAEEVAAFLAAGPDALIADGELSTREVAYMVEREHAVHVSDVVLRRTNLAFVGAVTHPQLIEIAEAMGSALGWDRQRVRTEAELCADYLSRFHGLTIDVGTPG